MTYRLCEENATALLPLCEQDLFKISFCPPSLGVRIVNIFGTPAGRVEYGEYVVRRGASHFTHSAFQLDEFQLAQLHEFLAVLKGHSPPVFRDDDEEPERRCISLWVHGRVREYRIPVSFRHRSLKVTAKYKFAFANVWAAAVEPVHARRADDLRPVCVEGKTTRAG